MELTSTPTCPACKGHDLHRVTGSGIKDRAVTQVSNKWWCRTCHKKWPATE